MDGKLSYILSFLTCLTTILAKKGLQLPLCPTNINYLPQDLPMHCRMPRSAEFGGPPPGMLPAPPGVPFPFPGGPPPGVPPAPPGGPFPFPGVPPPGPFPMPIPMMPMPQPAHKLPVIVMPFYSPDPNFKKPKDHSKESIKKRKRGSRRRKSRRPSPHYTDSDTDTDTDSSDTDLSSDTSSGRSSDTSGDRGWWKRQKSIRKSGRRSNRKHSHKSKKKYVKAQKDLLTPVLQYVTKDGYVIFEKQISKNEAKDWLRIKQDNGDRSEENGANEDEEKIAARRSKSKEDIKIEKEKTTTVKPSGHKNHFRHVKANSVLSD